MHHQAIQIPESLTADSLMIFLARRPMTSAIKEPTPCIPTVAKHPDQAFEVQAFTFKLGFLAGLGVSELHHDPAAYEQNRQEQTRDAA